MESNVLFYLFLIVAEMLEEAIETTLQDLARDYFFLFCVHFTCDQTYNVSHHAVVYQKDPVTKIILDIVDRWYMFPVPFKVLKRAMKDIICLTFMRPSYDVNRKTAIIRRLLYPIAHIPGLNNADREALKQLFHAIVRRLLTEDPTAVCLKTLLDTLTFYFNEDDVQERALATSSIKILLANALKYNNLTAGVINGILPQELSALFQNISEVDVQAVIQDVFPALD